MQQEEKNFSNSKENKLRAMEAILNTPYFLDKEVEKFYSELCFPLKERARKNLNRNS